MGYPSLILQTPNSICNSWQVNSGTQFPLLSNEGNNKKSNSHWQRNDQYDDTWRELMTRHGKKSLVVIIKEKKNIFWEKLFKAMYFWKLWTYQSPEYHINADAVLWVWHGTWDLHGLRISRWYWFCWFVDSMLTIKGLTLSYRYNFI